MQEPDSKILLSVLLIDKIHPISIIHFGGGHVSLMIYQALNGPPIDLVHEVVLQRMRRRWWRCTGHGSVSFLFFSMCFMWDSKGCEQFGHFWGIPANSSWPCVFCVFVLLFFCKVQDQMARLLEFIHGGTFVVGSLFSWVAELVHPKNTSRHNQKSAAFFCVSLLGCPQTLGEPPFFLQRSKKTDRVKFDQGKSGRSSHRSGLRSLFWSAIIVRGKPRTDLYPISCHLRRKELIFFQWRLMDFSAPPSDL